MSPNKTDPKTGATALILASENGHLKVVRALPDRGADVNATTTNGVTAMIAAYVHGHSAVGMELMRWLINAKDEMGFTRLMLASYTGDLVVVRAWLDSNADVNVKANDGRTALIIASQVGHLEVVRALLDRGADVNAKDNDGGTALIGASQNGHLEVVQLLKQKGARE